MFRYTKLILQTLHIAEEKQIEYVPQDCASASDLNSRDFICLKPVHCKPLYYQKTDQKLNVHKERERINFQQFFKQFLNGVNSADSFVVEKYIYSR